ncbi:MAG: hypothetical protein SFV24_15620 [Gemmatimonadales bacterium]|nr:hypothetical protein [Gemmatimonadales bacterium]
MRSCWLALTLLAPVSTVVAQEWNDPAARALADRAAGARALAIADSTLISYSARAHGFVTFLAELAWEVGSAPRVIKADELLVEVYWQRPDRSKQVIRAWRDSTFLPTDLAYHRDHLGIVSDDVGALIRIGEGDEVLDLPHPLGPEVRDRYDVRLGDTLRIGSGATRVTLVELFVRPRNPAEPAVIGSFAIDVERAVVVRSRLAFTPAAYRDRDLEDIVVSLERALVDGQYWLPYRQEIEIRRRSAIVDFPLRGVIRGRWEIGDHRVNDGVPAAVVSGPSIGGLLRPDGRGFDVPIAARVDSGLVPAERDDLDRVRGAAARAVRRRMLSGLPTLRPAVTRVSDILRVNRVEGLRFGIGVAGSGGPIDRASVRAGYGTADRLLTGTAEFDRVVGRATVGLRAQREVVDVGDWPATSGVVNSLAAQEGGRDLGDYVLRTWAGVEVRWPAGAGGENRVAAGRLGTRSVAARARPARGDYRPNPALGDRSRWVASAAVIRGQSRVSGPRWRSETRAEVGSGGGGYGRLVSDLEVGGPVAGGDLTVRGRVGLGAGDLPRHRTFAIGGAGTLPGEAFRAFGGRRAGFLAADWLVPLPGPAVGLGVLGRTSSRMRVGPMIGLGWAAGGVAGVPWAPSRGGRPVAGLVVELFDRSVRLEVGQRLRNGGRPTLSIDVARAWWPVL